MSGYPEGTGLRSGADAVESFEAGDNLVRDTWYYGSRSEVAAGSDTRSDWKGWAGSGIPPVSVGWGKPCLDCGAVG